MHPHTILFTVIWWSGCTPPVLVGETSLPVSYLKEKDKLDFVRWEDCVGCARGARHVCVSLSPCLSLPPLTIVPLLNLIWVIFPLSLSRSLTPPQRAGTWHTNQALKLINNNSSTADTIAAESTYIHGIPYLTSLVNIRLFLQNTVGSLNNSKLSDLHVILVWSSLTPTAGCNPTVIFEIPKQVCCTRSVGPSFTLREKPITLSRTPYTHTHPLQCHPTLTMFIRNSV